MPFLHNVTVANKMLTWCKYTFNPLDNLYRYGFIRIMLTRVTVLSLFLPCAFPLRCYTDIPATKVWKLRREIVILTNFVNLQSLSVECGMNTGCLKIFKKAEQFDEYGTFIPPHRRGEDTQLFRGEIWGLIFSEGPKIIGPVTRVSRGGGNYFQTYAISHIDS